MSTDNWITVATTLITLIANSVLVWKIASRPTEVIVLTAQPAEKAKTKKVVGKTESGLPLEVRKGYGFLLVIAIAGIFLAGLDLYEAFASPPPILRRHLLLAVMGTFGLINGAVFVGVAIYILRKSKTAVKHEPRTDAPDNS